MREVDLQNHLEKLEEEQKKFEKQEELMNTIREKKESAERDVYAMRA